ncbi:hypothetical protein SDC9_194489 [bioreactor metagenome]|uniref:Uncharacterized protein n=1 Tax=bioreactor metagenome TaxID=1076179 RepID=A0A645I711_9ZZZZ
MAEADRQNPGIGSPAAARCQHQLIAGLLLVVAAMNQKATVRDALDAFQAAVRA